MKGIVASFERIVGNFMEFFIEELKFVKSYLKRGKKMTFPFLRYKGKKGV